EPAAAAGRVVATASFVACRLRLYYMGMTDAAKPVRRWYRLPDKAKIAPPTDGLEPRTLQLPCYT
ncbi:MAG: hypothetical protein ABSG68_21600, partial [Thermoguttaceae bacterium]